MRQPTPKILQLWSIMLHGKWDFSNAWDILDKTETGDALKDTVSEAVASAGDTGAYDGAATEMPFFVLKKNLLAIKKVIGQGITIATPVLQPGVWW